LFHTLAAFPIFKKIKPATMDLKQIQELIKMVNKSNLSEVSIEEKDFKITIKQKEEVIQQTVISAGYPSNMIPAMSTAPAPAAIPAATPAAPPPAAKPAEDNSKYVTIKSPMIGTFYRKPSPDKPVFAEVGDEVTPGKVVCIIEAMKLFNEIESEIKGKIVKVLVDDHSPVEYDQPLFLVDPS
jgi:acetyl-CoA carboxylase biotin carboxyl carrier protein